MKQTPCHFFCFHWINNKGYKVFIVNILNFLLSVSSTIVFSIAPFFITENLQLSNGMLMFIESFNEGFSNLGKMLSGVVIDKFKRVRGLFFIGVLLGFLSKVLLLFCGALSFIVSKFIERLSNGVFAVTRDTFVALRADKGYLGRAYKNMLSVKTAGCILGSFFAGFLVESGLSFNMVIISSIMPIFIGLICCALLKESSAVTESKAEEKLDWNRFKSDVFSLDKTFYYMIAIVFLFMVGRVSDGLIGVRLKEIGMPQWVYISAIGIFNVTSFIGVNVIGFFSDRINKRILLLVPIFSLMLCNHCMMQDEKIYGAIGVCLWGIQRGTSQLFFTSIFAEILPKNIKGTGMATYYLVCSIGGFFLTVFAFSKISVSTYSAFLYGFYIMSFVCMLHFIYTMKLLVKKSPSYSKDA